MVAHLLLSKRLNLHKGRHSHNPSQTNGIGRIFIIITFLTDYLSPEQARQTPSH